MQSGDEQPALSGALSMMSVGASQQSGQPAPGVSGSPPAGAAAAQSSDMPPGSHLLAPSASQGTRQLSGRPMEGDENVNILQTPRALGSRREADKGYFTPSRSNLRGSVGRTVTGTAGTPLVTPVPPRRDLGAGSTLYRRTPGSKAMHADTSVSGDDDDGRNVFTMVWGTDINIADVRNHFMQFVRGFRQQTGVDDAGLPILQPEAKYMAYLKDIIAQDEDNFSIDCRELRSFSPQLYNNLVTYPREVIPILDDVVAGLARAIRDDDATLAPPGRLGSQGPEGSQAGDGGDDAPAPHAINVRPYNLAEDKAIRDLDPNDVESLVQVQGMVTRASAVTPDMRVAYFMCSRCGTPVWVANEAGRVKSPSQCSNQACGARHLMQLVHNQCLFTDKQLVKLQESPDIIPEGETPHAVTAFVFDALVDFVRPGDRVTLVGMYRAAPVRANPRVRVLKSVLRSYIDVLHIQLSQKDVLFHGTAPQMDSKLQAVPGTPGSQAGSETGSQDMHIDTQDPFGLGNLARRNLVSMEENLVRLGSRADIYERLTASLAPSIWQMDDVKKGILCQLFGAVNKDGKGRNMINVLLVGDPGVSKSQLLTYVHRVAPRGLYTSGRGSSAVGLTAYVTKDPENGEHVLESGALVLSDQGICCIDEFDKMSDSARAMLHEVMEQQTVSVAKAGIIATLNARTSVLAAANPRTSKYDPRASIVENINLPPSLLSRFDLVYLLLDKANPNDDKRLARHLTSLFWQAPPESTRASIPLETLKEYVAFCRHKVHPKLGADAAALLVQGYLEMRNVGVDAMGNTNRNVISATPRQLESLIRLSEALARMELKEEVLEHHVEEALRLMQDSMKQSAMDTRTGMIDMDKLYSGVGAMDREMRRYLAEVIGELLTERGEEMSVLEITKAVNNVAGQGGVHATHALVQKVLAGMDNIQYDAGRGRAKRAL